MCGIANKIKSRRIELGLTLEDVARAVNVGRSTVRKWETGMIKNMGRDKIAKLATVLHMDPIEFVPMEEVHSVRMTIEDEELQKLWAGSSVTAKRTAMAVLREMSKE